MDASHNNHHTSQNTNNFQLSSGTQDLSGTPGREWTGYRQYNVSQAGSARKFGFNAYSNAPYTFNTAAGHPVRFDNPAFYGLADSQDPSQPYNNGFESHSSFYASSLNQSEESLGNGLKDHLNESSAGLEEDDVEDLDNAAGITTGTAEREARKKEREADKRKKDKEKKDKTPATKAKPQGKKGKGSKSGVNRHDKGGSDEEVSLLDPKDAKSADIEATKGAWPYEDKLALVTYIVSDKVWKDLKIKQSEVFTHVSFSTAEPSIRAYRAMFTDLTGCAYRA